MRMSATEIKQRLEAIAKEQAPQLRLSRDRLIIEKDGRSLRVSLNPPMETERRPDWLR